MTNGFDFCHPIDSEERVGMMEWRRLKGCTSYSRLRAWVRNGARSASGRTVKLPTFQHGGRSYTTLEAYQWFCLEQQK